MKLAIMQPYFMPYLGYFQLIANVDSFIVYDRIKYTKKGWINRNRILRNGESVTISIPLQAGSDTLDVIDRCISADFNPDKPIRQIEGAYRSAPFFNETMDLVSEIFAYNNHNLFYFNLNSIHTVCRYLGVKTSIQVSSSLNIDKDLRGQDKVLALCEASGADVYINPIGGIEIYEREAFAAKNVELRFLRSLPFIYEQFDKPFVPWLSIIDVMMFNSRESISCQLGCGWLYE